MIIASKSLKFFILLKIFQTSQATVEVVVKDDIDDQVESDEEFAPNTKGILYNVLI